MRLEYTAIHNRFKALVDDLLTGFLEELGVSPETFLEVATKMGTDKLNEFVVSSILTVDNFVQFRNMMVQRNIDLTHQALSQLEEERAAETAAKLSLAEIRQMVREMFKKNKKYLPQFKKINI